MRAILLAILFALSPSLAQAQTYPDRTITMVIPFAAGGPTDTVARLVGEAMSKDLGQQVIVENYPGELTVYDLSTGNSQARLRFKTSASFVRFSLDGKRLLVLTAGQVAYAFDVDKMSAGK